MSTDRAVAARAAANPLMPNTQTVAFATGVTAATVPAYVNEVFVSVANDVAGVLTIAARPAFSQLLVHIGDFSSSGSLTIYYNGAPISLSSLAGNTDTLLISSGGQLIVGMTIDELVALVADLMAS